MSAAAPARPAKAKLLRLAARVLVFLAVAWCLGGLLNKATAHTNADPSPAGFGRGALHGAMMPLALRRQLSQLASSAILPNAPDGAPRSLSELGLATNRDGTFRYDPAVLQRVLTSAPAGVAAFFTPGLRGVFATIDRIARNASVGGDPGSLGGSVARYSALKSKLADDRAKLDTQLENIRAQFIKRFAGADVRVGASRSTLSFLQNQIAAWNAPRS